MILPLLLLATMMAVFGTLAYLKGSKWAIVALLILLLAFIAIKVAGDQIVLLLNGLYTGIMLVLNGGMGDLASGDLDALKETLASIDKPFTDENENLALLLVILGAVGIGLLLYAVMKKKKSTVFSLILGIIYGYVFAAAAVPLITNIPASSLPVPIIQPADRSAQEVQAAQSRFDQLLATLSSPENIQILSVLIGAFIVLLLLLTVRKGVKNPGKKG
jgi:hypothetical protein